MVLGLDCFGLMARKVSKSSGQKEAGDAMKQKDAAEEASPKAEEKKGDKAVEQKSKEDTRAPLVVPHFPQRSTPGLL
ncbi:hypothetical protein HU200_059543 [Digitaria exilis]|uniref:Uncharacterized protein n=1 Tax=Digitaria exilis TaxID=1010633 RepID=A0A835ABL2_9POAL|nr:hypothetical protein HU200_059543 [Digitaria exilis]CAB3459603.1 unnamed protein product [Digitaria exilis]